MTIAREDLRTFAAEVGKEISTNAITAALKLAEEQKSSTYSMKLSAKEHWKIAGFLVVHTVIVVGSLVAAVWSYTSTTDRRLQALELRVQMILESQGAMRGDMKDLTSEVRHAEQNRDRAH